MKTIEAYRTSDGMLFEHERAASNHQDDLKGEALDTLLPAAYGNWTRTDRHKLLMAMMEDGELVEKVAALYNILEYMAENKED